MNYKFILKTLKSNIGIMIFGTLISLAIFPFAFYVLNLQQPLEGYGRVIESSREYFVILQGCGLIFYLLAIISAISVFSYLFKRDGSDFYHSLAMKRSKLLAMNFVSGCLIFLIPLAIGYGALILRCIPIAEQVAVVDIIGLLFLSFLFNVLMLVLFFTMFTLCATYASSIVSTFVVFWTLFIMPLLSLGSVILLVDRFLLGYASDVYLIDFEKVDGILTPGDVLFMCIVVLIATVIVYVFAHRSYKNRKSENHSKMLSSNRIKNLFLFSTLFVITTFALYIFDGATYTIALIVSLVTFVLAKAFTDKGFKSVFTKISIVKYASFLTAMAGMIVAFWSGILGNNEVPTASEVEGVVVADKAGWLNVPYSRNNDDGICTDPETIELALEMHEEIISQIAYPVASTGEGYNEISITYYMENGEEVKYMYTMEDIPDLSIMSDFVNSPENKDNIFYFLDDSYEIYGVWCDRMFSMDGKQYYLSEFFTEPEELTELAEAVKTDVMSDPELTVKNYDPEMAGEEEPTPEEVLFTIEFSGDNKMTGDNFYVGFVIKDSYTNTLQCIDETMEEKIGYGLEDIQ